MSYKEGPLYWVNETEAILNSWEPFITDLLKQIATETWGENNFEFSLAKTHDDLSLDLMWNTRQWYARHHDPTKSQYRGYSHYIATLTASWDYESLRAVPRRFSLNSIVTENENGIFQDDVVMIFAQALKEGPR